MVKVRSGEEEVEVRSGEEVVEEGSGEVVVEVRSGEEMVDVRGGEEVVGVRRGEEVVEEGSDIVQNTALLYMRAMGYNSSVIHTTPLTSHPGHRDASWVPLAEPDQEGTTGTTHQLLLGICLVQKAMDGAVRVHMDRVIGRMQCLAHGTSPPPSHYHPHPPITTHTLPSPPPSHHLHPPIISHSPIITHTLTSPPPSHHHPHLLSSPTPSHHHPHPPITTYPSCHSLVKVVFTRSMCL